MQEILTKLNYKESRKGKRGRPRLSEIAKYYATPPSKKGRRAGEGGESAEPTPPDTPTLQYKPIRPPRKTRKVSKMESPSVYCRNPCITPQKRKEIMKLFYYFKSSINIYFEKILFF